MQNNIEDLLSNGLVDKDFYNNELKHYFKFNWKKIYPGAKPVLITTVPCTVTNVYF